MSHPTLPEELIEQIVEDLFAIASLREVFLARGISGTFARIINHRLFATTPREIFFKASEENLLGASTFLIANLATHLYHHARKPCTSGHSELPDYVNHVVDELLGWTLPEPEATPLRDHYIKDTSEAIVATRPAAAYQLLFTRRAPTDPRMKYLTRPAEPSHRWFEHTDEAQLWGYVGDRTSVPWNLRLLRQHLMFGNLFATAASTGKDATLEYLLKRLDKQLIDYPLDAPSVCSALHEAVKAAISSSQPRTTTTLIEYIMMRFAGLRCGTLTNMPELRRSWVVEAARTGNIDNLHKILDLIFGHSLDKDSGLIVTAYRTACAAGHVAKVRDLLDRGLANVKQDARAFLQAIENGNRCIIKLLVERGASRLTWFLWPTAIKATKTSAYRLTEFLIEEGFPVTDEAAQAIGELYSLYGCLSDDQLAAAVTICDNVHEIQGPEVADELYHRYVRGGLPWYSYVADPPEPLRAEEMEELYSDRAHRVVVADVTETFSTCP